MAPTGGSGVVWRETASGSARARGGAGRGGAGLTLVWACCVLQVVCCGGLSRFARRLHLHELHSCTEMKVH